MLKYNVGDHVRVRTDLVPGTRYGESDVMFNAQMHKRSGKVVTIKELLFGGYNIYDENGAENPYYWVDEMLEEVSGEDLFDAENLGLLYDWFSKGECKNAV